IERNRHKLLADKVIYVVHVGDMAVKHLYRPIGKFTLFSARFLQHEHERGIHAYLAYTFFTILFLLAVYI
ncbi:MAG: hydrogenase 4 subunit B, partial [Mariprofundaceae bacterium]|nr:hydrogenase 4 subunit B [Mariprofundaceae bacterium]